MIRSDLTNSNAPELDSTHNARIAGDFRSARRAVGHRAGLLGLCLALAASPLQSQDAAVVGPQRATRAMLAAQLATLEQRLAANDRKVDRNKAMAEVAAIRKRLTEGDFRVGDQFVVTTTTDLVRIDTASVRDSLLVAIATLPDVSLRGVLRSELTEKLSMHVARFLRNATVRTNVLTRVQIIGAVNAPGFYLSSPDRPISDLLMLAGGPSPTANVNELEVRRGGRQVLSAKDSRSAVKEGRTLEQIDLQSGDEVRIPSKRRINWQAVLQVFGIISALLFSVISFLRIYYESQDR